MIGCMTLAIDMTAAVRTVAEQRQLVQAVLDAPATKHETDFIEWKSLVDLADARWRFEAGRYVLGSNNRDPEVAARTFEGCAYMLLGVEPDR
jgi:hypothetical protein